MKWGSHAVYAEWKQPRSLFLRHKWASPTFISLVLLSVTNVGKKFPAQSSRAAGKSYLCFNATGSAVLQKLHQVHCFFFTSGSRCFYGNTLCFYGDAKLNFFRLCVFLLRIPPGFINFGSPITIKLDKFKEKQKAKRKKSSLSSNPSSGAINYYEPYEGGIHRTSGMWFNTTTFSPLSLSLFCLFFFFSVLISRFRFCVFRCSVLIFPCGMGLGLCEGLGLHEDRHDGRESCKYQSNSGRREQ